MRRLLLAVTGAALALGAGVASARSDSDLPPDAQTPDAAAVSQLLAGRTFVMSPRQGGELVLEHAADGGMKLSVGGRSDTGTWKTEHGRVCYELKVFRSACNEVREAGSDIYFRRPSGEVVKLVPQ